MTDSTDETGQTGETDQSPLVDESVNSEADLAPDGDVDEGVQPASSKEANDDGIQTLPLLPLRGTVVFPLTVVPLAAAQPRSLRLIDEVMSGDRTVALVMQKDSEQEGAGPDDVLEIGTIATIHQMMRVPDGSVRLAVQGIERMRIIEFVGEEPFEGRGGQLGLVDVQVDDAAVGAEQEPDVRLGMPLE